MRRHVRVMQREAQLALGRKLFDEIVARLKRPLDDAAIAEALQRLKLSDRNALYIALARQTLGDSALLEAVLPGSTVGLGKTGKRGAKAGARSSGQQAAIPIAGLSPGVAYRLEECCHPIPGDRIIGLRRPGTGIEVHRIDCAVLEGDDGSEWLDLRWVSDSEIAVAQIVAVVHNKPGALAAVTGILAHHGVNIVNLNLRDRDRQFHSFVIDMEVDGLAHLTSIIAALRATQAVVSVERG